jgi:PAB1-binding protein PBP1
MKYNVKSTYDENNYTTTLDKKNISNEQKNKAEKIIKEIMRDSNKDTNIHVLEDRGLIEENDLDEEQKYSSVIRNQNNDKDDK